MTFAPGKSGNPRGRPKDRPVKDTLRLVLADAEQAGTRRSLRSIMERVTDLAADGDMQAVQFIADRLEGKVPQVVVGDDTEDAITIRQIITGVPRAADDV